MQPTESKTRSTDLSSRLSADVTGDAAADVSGAEVARVADQVARRLNSLDRGMAVGGVAGWCLALGPAGLPGTKATLPGVGETGPGEPATDDSEAAQGALIGPIGSYRLYLHPLPPARFNRQLEAAVRAHFDPRTPPAPDWVIQFLLTASPSRASVHRALRQTLTEAGLPRDRALLRLSALGTDWIDKDPASPGLSLRDLLDQGALRSVDQGIFAAGAARPDRFETLARFVGPDGQLISAARVLRGDEPDAVLAELDQRMLRASVERLRQSPALQLTVNVCRSSLVDPAWLALFKHLRQAQPEAMARVILEVTEWPTRAVQTPLADSSATMAGLGPDLWLDDFGAGLTSFNEMLLRQLSGIKIDRSLLRRSLDAGGAFQALRIVTDLARRLDQVCVIEGVETPIERAHAEELGATHVQGYFSGVI